uniref:Uncharacterized protein n=1 Tax=Acrobeloides nanus TaxID=290746 RepID=A0A914CD68_9BILA
METSMIISRMQHIGPRGTEPADRSAERFREGHRIAEEAHEAQTLREKASEMAHDAKEKLGEIAESAKQKIKEAGKKLKGGE